MNVLDSDLLIANLRNNPQASKTLDFLVGSHNAITTITEMEIWFGETRRKNKEHQGIVQMLEGLESLAFDSESAKIAGKISAELVAKGKDIGVQDSMIAAITLRHNAVLYTRNLKHFQRVPGLNVKRW